MMTIAAMISIGRLAHSAYSSAVGWVVMFGLLFGVVCVGVAFCVAVGVRFGGGELVGLGVWVGSVCVCVGLGVVVCCGVVGVVMVVDVAVANGVSKAGDGVIGV
jgi:hypothetical protein